MFREIVMEAAWPNVRTPETAESSLVLTTEARVVCRKTLVLGRPTGLPPVSLDLLCPNWATDPGISHVYMSKFSWKNCNLSCNSY